MWRMPILFQESVRGIIDSSPGLILADDKPGTARIYDADGKRRRSSKVDPDLVLHGCGGQTLLVDTKYKDALPSSHEADDEEVTVVADRHRIKIGRADIYQVVAYRQHEKWPRSTAALLYPLILTAGDPLPGPMELQGFGAAVSLTFLDIGQHASTNLPDFLATLRQLAGDNQAAGSSAALA